MYLLFIRICLPLQLVYSKNEFGVFVYASDDDIWNTYKQGNLRPGLGLTGLTGSETRLESSGKEKESVPLQIIVNHPISAFNSPEM